MSLQSESATNRSGAAIAAPEPVLSLSGISKRYPGVIALDDINLTVKRGTIHAVVGENGAGKSTLIKIITGITQADDGEIRFNGMPAGISDPREANSLGIVSVPQDILLVPELLVGRNILLGMERSLARREALNDDETTLVAAALAQVGANFGPETPTRSLSVPQLRLAQIARALVQEGEVIIFDEPTAVLSEPDAEHLLERILAFRESGKAIIYITHRLGEVMRIADQVTVLRDGKCVGSFPRGDFDRSRLVSLMAKVENSAEAARVPTGPSAPKAANTDYPKPSSAVAVSVEGLTLMPRFADVTFSVRRGEIVGLAGVQDSGHGHVLRAIAGVDNSQAGRVVLFGKPVDATGPSEVVNEGMLLVPADRRGSGIVGARSVQENIALSPRIPTSCRRWGFRLLRSERALTLAQIDQLSIHPRSPDIYAGNLSGGNQQKVALARALSGHVQVLLTEEPTQGIDVRSRVEIHDLLRKIAREQNCALVIASSEFDELIGLADVINVMRLGRLVATIAGDKACYQDILHEALP
jgi:ABC-type sugar transport system ATPase subunit